MLHSYWQHTRCSVITNSLAFGVHTDLLELKELLELHLAILHTKDLGDADDAAHAATKARLLNDQVDGRADRLANSARREGLAGLQHQRLQADQALLRVVGVQGRHGPILARAHGLEHVQSLTTTTLTDDDAVGTHTQTALDQLANRYRALAFDVGRAGLELDPVRLLQLQLGGILAGDEALGLRNERGQDVQQSRLAGAGATRDQDVESRPHARAEEGHQFRARRAEAVDDIGRSPLLLGELSDREARTFERDGRNDHVDTRAVLQARVTDRSRLVDATADKAHDAVDHLSHLPLRFERHRRQRRLAAFFDIDLLRVVGHDFGDARVCEQRLERTESEDVVEDRVDKPFLVGLGHRHGRAAEVLFRELHDLFAHAGLVAGVDLVGELLD